MERAGRRLVTGPGQPDELPPVLAAPRVGDQGVIVHVLSAESGAAGRYTVECVDDAGMTVWVADFAADELVRVEIM